MLKFLNSLIVLVDIKSFLPKKEEGEIIGTTSNKKKSKTNQNLSKKAITNSRNKNAYLMLQKKRTEEISKIDLFQEKPKEE
jgi:hypothetical protein